MLKEDENFLELISIKRLTYNDLRECVRIYSRNASYLSRLFCVNNEDVLPQSILELRSIACCTSSKQGDEHLDEETKKALQGCIEYRTLRNSAATRDIKSCTSKIFFSLMINPGLGSQDKEFNKKLEPEKRVAFLQNMMKKVRYLDVNQSAVNRNLEGLMAIADGTWKIYSNFFNEYLTPGGRKIFLDAKDYKSGKEATILVNHIFEIFFGGYQIAERYNQYEAYFKTFSDWDCLAGSSRNLTKWLLQWSDIISKRPLTMNELMERATKVMPADLKGVNANSDEALAWYADNFAGAIIDNKPLSEDDIRKYMCEWMGHDFEPDHSFKCLNQ